MDAARLVAEKEHSELVERVAKEKLVAKFGQVPTDDELREHGAILPTPDNWYHMTYRGETLIEWSGDLRVNVVDHKLVRDYRY